MLPMPQMFPIFMLFYFVFFGLTFFLFFLRIYWMSGFKNKSFSMTNFSKLSSLSFNQTW